MKRRNGLKGLPKGRGKNPNQRWIFMTDESPLHRYVKPRNKILSAKLLIKLILFSSSFYNNNFETSGYDGIFNWTMSYRPDSDVPVPYGRPVLLRNKLSPVKKWTLTNRFRIIFLKAAVIIDSFLTIIHFHITGQNWQLPWDLIARERLADGPSSII